MFQARKARIIIVVTILLLSAQAMAADTSKKTFDQQRPDNISDQKWLALTAAVQEVKLLPSPEGVSQEISQFGTSVAVDGNRALVGAPDALIKGVAYVLEYDGVGWVETIVLRPPEDELFISKFGYAVSLSGDRALVGAYGLGAGSAYIFDFVTGNWVGSKLVASDGATSDYFGYSVSLSGDRALIGAYRNGQPGSAYIFDLLGNNWVETSKLTPSDGSNNARFGYSVSLSGDRVIIGAFQDDDNGPSSGSAYIFDLIGNNWVETKLIASDIVGGDKFGRSVSVSGDRVLIGANLDDDNGTFSGSAFIFDLVDGNWVETKLLPSDGAENDRFGFSVSLSGDRALVGAYISNSAYIFDLIGGNWIETKLTASDQTPDGAFGVAVSLSNKRALIGTYRYALSPSKPGSAYIFDSADSGWAETKLTAKEGSTKDRFGSSVSLAGTRAIVGAAYDNEDGPNSGSVYIFDRINNTWIGTKITASDSAEDDWFGSSVSMSGNRILIGSPHDDDSGSDSGSVYILDLIGNNWVETKLMASDGLAGNKFGQSVSISNDRLLIGAKEAAYVFDLVTGIWVETKLTASDSISGDLFGFGVKVDNNRLIISAPGDQDSGFRTGSAYIFDLIDNDWLETKLTASDSASFDFFGGSLSISGDRVLVGARYNDNENGSSAGAAYIFDLIDGNWIETKIIANDGVENGGFASSVSLQGNQAVVTASGNANSTSSLAYVFNLTSSSWVEAEQIIPSSQLISVGSLRSLSLSANLVLIGAPGSDERGTDSGSAYIYCLASPCSLSNAIFSSGFESQ